MYVYLYIYIHNSGCAVIEGCNHDLLCKYTYTHMYKTRSNNSYRKHTPMDENKERCKAHRIYPGGKSHRSTSFNPQPPESPAASAQAQPCRVLTGSIMAATVTQFTVVQPGSRCCWGQKLSWWRDRIILVAKLHGRNLEVSFRLGSVPAPKQGCCLRMCPEFEFWF